MTPHRRFHLLTFALVLLGCARGTAATGAPAGASSLTNTVITCTNGASYLSTNAVFRGEVRVFDPQLYMECELLTVYFPSNHAGATLKGDATPGVGNISTIVARTNILMMMRGATIIGDRAVYSATNDIIDVTGEIVVIETESGYAYGTHFIFNRQSMELQSVGPSTLESKPGVSLIEGTNRAAVPPPLSRPRRNTSPAPPIR